MESKGNDFYGLLDVLLKKAKKETKNYKQMVSFYQEVIEHLREISLEQHHYIMELERYVKLLEAHTQQDSVQVGSDQDQESRSPES